MIWIEIGSTPTSWQLGIYSCCGAEIISSGSGSTEPQIRIAAPDPGPNKIV